MTTLHDAQAEVEPSTFEAWYFREVGITLAEAVRRRVYDTEILAKCWQASAAQLQALTAERDALRDALKEVCAVIESNPPSIVDTVWVTGDMPETLLDHCRSALSASSTQKEQS